MQDIVKVLMSIISDPPIWENDTLENSGEDANPPHGQAAASKWTQPSPARPWCPHLTKEVTYPDSASPWH